VRATVDSVVTLDPRDDLKAWEQTKRDLTFPNPEFETLTRLGKKPYRKSKDGSWVKVPRTVSFWKDNGDGTVQVPRGAGTVLRHNVEKVGGRMRWSDQRLRLSTANLGAITFDPRPYQARAVEAMLSREQGTVVMPCGGGKTKTSIAALVHICQPTLVIVHTKALLKQWREVVREDLGIEPGVIGGGKVKETDLTVATVQTLMRWDSQRFHDLSTRYGCVIVDEAHHAPAYTFQEVVNRMPARFRYGFTATLHRSDGLTDLIEHVMGAVIFEAKYPELLRDGYLLEPRIVARNTNFAFTFKADRLREEAKAEGKDTRNIRVDPREYKACMDLLIADDERNALIADDVVSDAMSGHPTLVLTARIHHCEVLAQLVCERGVAAMAVHGELGKRKREAGIEAFDNGELPVLVATTLADEGLDVPRLSRLHLAYPTKDPGRTTQRIGRTMRLFPGKGTPVTKDYVDRGVSVLRNQYYQRRRVYKQFMTQTLGVQRELEGL
jgi:superfamily II DNA or RNA helicase